MSTTPPGEPDEYQTNLRMPSEGQTPQPQGAPLGGPGDPTTRFVPPPASYGPPASGYDATSQTPPSAPDPGYAQPGQDPGYAQPGYGGNSAQPGGGYDGGGGYQPPPAGYQLPFPGGSASTPRDANPFKAAFDMSFTNYATPSLVKLIYIVTIALAALWYVFSVIIGFAVGAPRDLGFGESDGSAVPGILALLLAWIPSALLVLLMRVWLESALANVRTATDARAIRERAESGQ